MTFFARIGVFLLIFIAFATCRKPTSANWDVDAVLPVVNSKLNIKNFFSDTLFKSDTDGLLYFNISREIGYIKLDSLLNLPDTTIPPQTFTAPVNGFLLTHENPLKNLPPAELEFSIGNGVELTRVDVKKGVLVAKFYNNISEALDLVCEIPNAKKDGQKFRIVETIPPGSNPMQRSYDLSGYSLNMTGISGNKVNTISQAYTVELNPNSNTLTLQGGQGAWIDISYSEIVPAYAEGYFGNQVIELPKDTADFGLSDNFKATNFRLSDVSLNFSIINEVGCDFSAALSDITSVNTFQNSKVVLENNKLSGLRINAAVKSGNWFTTRPYLLPFNTANSNINPFIANLPNKVAYKGSVEINPLHPQTANHGNFVYYNTGLRILADMNIPIRFSADNFRLKSEALINLSHVDQLDNVNSGNLVIYASNGYPFDAKLQAYMLDSLNNTIDSIFVSGANIVQGGLLNGANEVIQPNKSKVLIPLDRSKIVNLKRCRTIQTVAYFLMPQTPPDIPLREKYEIDVNIVAEINYNVGIQSRK